MSESQRDATIRRLAGENMIPKPTAWQQFPEKIHMNKGSGPPRFGPAEQNGDLQAEYVLNNVKRLRIPARVLEDIE